MENVDDFINRYPLRRFYKFECVRKDEKKNMEEKHFHYETPTINSNSCLKKKKTIKYYLEKYLANTERLLNKYIDANHPFNEIYALTYICEIYIQRVCEGIEKKPKKVLSIQDGDGPNPTYFIKGIRPNLFRSPFKIHAKSYLFIIYREKNEETF